MRKKLGKKELLKISLVNLIEVAKQVADAERAYVGRKPEVPKKLTVFGVRHDG
jgi:hypothetical protein